MNKLRLLKKLKQALTARYGDNIGEVVLFGSRVNGTARGDSDYDVLIVLNRDYGWQYRHRMISTIYELELEYDVFFDTKIISNNELRSTLKGKHPLYQDALQHGIHA